MHKHTLFSSKSQRQRAVRRVALEDIQRVFGLHVVGSPTLDLHQSQPLGKTWLGGSDGSGRNPIDHHLVAIYREVEPERACAAKQDTDGDRSGPIRSGRAGGGRHRGSSTSAGDAARQRRR